jgi:hypothetical protein
MEAGTMQYKLTFGRNAQIVPAIILPALILLIPLVLFLEFADQQLLRSEWIPIILSLVYFLLVLFLTLRLVNITRASVEISIIGDNLQFLVPKKNFFHHTDFNLSFQEIMNIGEDNDKGFDFLYFKTKHKGFRNFHITAKENNDQFIAFRDHVLSKEALFNTTAPVNSIITNKTIYQKWPMKVLAFLILLFLLTYPVVSFYIGNSWINNVKYWILVIAGTPVVMKVYYQNFIK